MWRYKATIKENPNNSREVEVGMWVVFYSNSSYPIGGHGEDVVKAFMDQFGVDIRKAGIISSHYIDVVRLD